MKSSPAAISPLIPFLTPYPTWVKLYVYLADAQVNGDYILNCQQAIDEVVKKL